MIASDNVASIDGYVLQFVRVKKDTPIGVMRKMRVDVSPTDTRLPEVELKFGIGLSFSSSTQFNENLERESKILWERA